MWRLIPDQDNLGASASRAQRAGEAAPAAPGSQESRQDARGDLPENEWKTEPGCSGTFTKLMKSKLRLQLTQVHIHCI